MNDATRRVPAPATNSILAVVMTARNLDASGRECTGLRPVGGATQLAARTLLTESSRDCSPDSQVLRKGAVASHTIWFSTSSLRWPTKCFLEAF